ncbi:hypothetical protein [Novipirellula caenicola]|uniref:Uncharacterized protein n=1 Tax=Novipirellula caenicola TaxID=1536901 RepID=A0ABP9W0S3_9BACT
MVYSGKIQLATLQAFGMEHDLGPDFSGAMIESVWKTQCRSINALAVELAQQCSSEFGLLILMRAAEFTKQRPPSLVSEAAERYNQSVNLGGVLGCIVDASLTASRYRKQRSRILVATEAFMQDTPLDHEPTHAASELQKIIDVICADGTCRASIR